MNTCPQPRNLPLLFLWLLVPLFWSVQPLRAQWMKCESIEGASVRSISEAGGSVFALINSKVFRSSDNGSSWRDLSLPNRSVTRNDICTFLDADGDVQLFVASEGGIEHHVVRDGRSSPVDIQLMNMGVHSVSVAQRSPFERTLFCGLDSGAAFQSFDDGAHWRYLDIPSGGLYGTKLFGYPDGVGGLIVYACTGTYGAFRSTNSGATWSRCVGIPSNAVNASAMVKLGSNRFRHVLGTYVAGFYLSDDDGVTWTKSNDGLDDLQVFSIVITADRDGRTCIIAGTGAGLVRSTDLGASWELVQRVNSGQAIFRICASTDSTSEQHIYAGLYAAGGVLHSSDAGKTWLKVNSGFEVIGYRLMATSQKGVNGPSVFMHVYGFGLFRSDDDGAHWTDLHAPYFATSLRSVAVCSTANGGEILLATTNDKVFRSGTNGDTWEPVASINFIQCISTVGDGGGGTDVYVSAYGMVIFRSTDYGTTWILENKGSDFAGFVTGMVALRTNAGETNLFACYNGVVVRSTNNGTKWSEPSGYNGLGLSGINAVHDTNGTWQLLAMSSTPGYLRSTDMGASWTPVHPPGIDYPLTGVLECISAEGDTILASGTSHGAVVLSLDHGRTWRVSPVVSEPGANSVAYLPRLNGSSQLFTDGEHIWKQSMSSITSVHSDHPESSQRVQACNVLSISPAPCASSTTITYQLQERSSVTFRLIDVTGNEVQNSVENSRDAGTHQHIIDVHQLPSGLYLLRVQVGNMTTNSMVHVVH